MDYPPPHLGLRHVALCVRAFEDTKRFYVEVLGFRVEWEPDADTAYLTSGSDNLALHRAPAASKARARTLDHLGIVVCAAADVDAWARHLEARGVALASRPRTHRDGARSLYIHDPDGNRVQIMHHPPISVPPAAD